MYSGRFRTIFVHVPRTGGQSVETVFLEKHGLSWDTRAALLLGRNPARGGRPKYLAHLMAKEYVELGYISSEDFASSLKFTITRHPFDRMLSEFRYRVQRRGVAFDEFLELLMRGKDDRHMIPASDYVIDGSGSVIVDRVVRFESLSRDFARLSLEIFGTEVELPHVNRADAIVPHDVLKLEVRNLIYQQYERDFDLFRYPRGTKSYRAPISVDDT